MDQDRLDEMREMFDHFDADSNGVIDRAEFGRLSDALDMGLSDAEADIGFGEIDTDGNGVISFDELVVWYAGD